MVLKWKPWHFTPKLLLHHSRRVIVGCCSNEQRQSAARQSHMQLRDMRHFKHNYITRKERNVGCCLSTDWDKGLLGTSYKYPRSAVLLRSLCPSLLLEQRPAPPTCSSLYSSLERADLTGAISLSGSRGTVAEDYIYPRVYHCLLNLVETPLDYVFCVFASWLPFGDLKYIQPFENHIGYRLNWRLEKWNRLSAVNRRNHWTEDGLRDRTEGGWRKQPWFNVAAPIIIWNIGSLDAC